MAAASQGVSAPSPTIGNMVEATQAVGGRLEFVASGGDRHVYRLGPTAYKVERNPDEGRRANEREHANARRFAGSRHIPPTSLYRVGGVTVVAMPYYPCKLTEFPEGSAEILAMLERFGDVTNENTRRDSAGELWLVDLATLKTP